MKCIFFLLLLLIIPFGSIGSVFAVSGDNNGIPPTKAFQVISNSTGNVTASKYNDDVTFVGQGGISIITDFLTNTIYFAFDIGNVTSGSGEVNTASNVGTGEAGVFKQKTGVNLELKTLKQGTGITITNNTSDISIVNSLPEATTASNLNAGVGVFSSEVGNDLQFKSLLAGSGVTITPNGTNIMINSTSIGDNLGNHIATQDLNINNNTLITDTYSIGDKDIDGVKLNISPVGSGNSHLTLSPVDVDSASYVTLYGSQTNNTDLATLVLQADGGDVWIRKNGMGSRATDPLSFLINNVKKLNIYPTMTNFTSNSVYLQQPVFFDKESIIKELPVDAYPDTGFISFYAKDKSGVSNLYWRSDDGTIYDLGAGSGEVNTASNLNPGTGIFASKVGVDLTFKSLLAGAGINLSNNSTNITITNTVTDTNTGLLDDVLLEGIEVSNSRSNLNFNDTSVINFNVQDSAGLDSANVTATIVTGSIGDTQLGTGIDTTQFGTGGVTSTEFGYIGTLSSDAQTQLNSKQTTTLTDGNILVGDVGNLASSVNPSGDIDVSNTGVFSINNLVIVNGDVSATAGINATKIWDGTVSDAEFKFINSLTSNAQTQLNTKVDTTANSGTGEGTILKTVSGTTITAKTLKQGTGITLANNADDITITSSGGSTVLLDGSAHTDTVAQTVSRGSLIYGDSTPKWNELTIGSSGKVIHSDGTDASWQTLVEADIPTLAKSKISTSGTWVKADSPASVVYDDEANSYVDGNLQTFTDDDFILGDNTGGQFYTFSTSDLAANRVVTMPLLAADDTFVFENFAQTLNAKTLTGLVSSSSGADAADAGIYRLSNAETIAWEASPAGTDVDLQVDANENFLFDADANNINLNSNPLTNANLGGQINFNGNTILNTGTLTLPTATTTLVGTTETNTISGAKTFNDLTLLQRNPADTFSYTIKGGAITAARQLTLPITTQTETLAVQPQKLSSAVGNPTGTTNTSGLMAGIGGTCTITPRVTGNIFIIITGQGNTNTGDDGWGADLRYGTGTAPTNGAALVGTVLQLVLTGSAPATTSVTDPLTAPITLQGIGTGLTVGTAYWIDIGQRAVTGGTASFTNIQCTAFEL